MSPDRRTLCLANLSESVCDCKPRRDLKTFPRCRSIGETPPQRLFQSPQVVRLDEGELLLDAAQTGLVVDNVRWATAHRLESA